jgi:peroxiredoxin
MRRPMAVFSIILGFVLIAAALAAYSSGEDLALIDLGGSGDDAESDGGEITTAPEVGSYAPDFSLESVSGEQVQLSDYHGQVILVNFWAVWCPPCRQEMPAIQQAADQYGGQLAVLMVNAGDAKADAADFLEDYGFTFLALLDSTGQVNNQYRVRGLPTTFIIDEEGVIQIMHVGLMEESDLAGYLAEMGLAQ